MAMNPSNWIEFGIGAVVFILVMAAILPDALNDWFNVSTDEWPTSVASIWDLIIVLILVALAYLGWNAINEQN